MKKACTRCGESKPRKEFYKQSKKGKDWDCRDSMCKLCRSEYATERRRRVKRQAIALLGGKCIDCGLVDDPVVYDFHHPDPSKKKFSPGQNNFSFEKIKKELGKCVLLCSNCHRKRHVGAT